MTAPVTWQYRHDDLNEHECFSGIVDRLPMPGAPNGNSLYLSNEQEKRAIHATAKTGHTVLERKLAELCVRVGDRVQIVYLGKRPTADGEREYRLYEVNILQRG